MEFCTTFVRKIHSSIIRIKLQLTGQTYLALKYSHMNVQENE